MPAKARPFVEQLVPLAGQLHAILTHMERFRDSEGAADDAPPIPEVLASLLDGALTPLARRRPDELAAAALVLAEVARTIEEELFLVPPPQG